MQKDIRKKLSVSIKLLCSLKKHNGQITVLKAGHQNNQNNLNQQLLISGSSDHNIIVWRLNRQFSQESQEKIAQKQLHILSQHHYPVTDLSLTPDNSYFLSSSKDKTIILWDLKKNQLFSIFQEDQHKDQITSCAFSPDCRKIISSGLDGKMKLWNTLGSCKYTFVQAHQNGISKVRFLPFSSKSLSLQGQTIIVSIGYDGYIKLWDIQNLTLKKQFKLHQQKITDISFFTSTSTQTQIISTASYKTVKILTLSQLLSNKITQAQIVDFDEEITCLSFSFHPNTRQSLLAVGTQSGWEILQCQYQRRQINNQQQQQIKITKLQKIKQYQKVTSIEWNSKGDRLYIGTQSGIIKIYQIQQISKSNIAIS